MPVLNRIAEYADDMRDWRRWLHRNPELGFELPRTTAFVAGKLREFGVDEVHEGIAQSGLVGVVQGQGAGPCIGLRADMDALPIDEATGADHASETPGKMHACGHDGHTTMLLGAARYLAETRNFKGRVALIFQPAEEYGGGGEVMVREGILDRFGIVQVYGLHNAPQYDRGAFHTNPGALMAAVDEFQIVVRGKGGHAAYPHECADPLAAAAAMIQAIHSIPARNQKPTQDLVIAVCQLHCGTANNVIADRAVLSGTVRSFEASVRDMAFRRLAEIAQGVAAAMGVTAEIEFDDGYPATINDPGATAFAAEVAREIAGDANVHTDAEVEMGAEDFSYMLNARPGCYLFLGQGGGPYCHHPAYDFNDEIAPVGASFFARLVECAQPVR